VVHGCLDGNDHIFRLIFQSGGKDEMEPVVRRSAGLDTHRNSVVVTVLIEQDDGSIFEETREFGTFKKDRRELCAWLTDHRIELAVMESTSIYWKAIFSALEGAGITSSCCKCQACKECAWPQDRC
jgi:hypothetical protein